jgi:hypothetical protein
MLAAQTTVLERTPFAIDDPQDEFSDDEDGGVVDDNMLDEVFWF